MVQDFGEELFGALGVVPFAGQINLDPRVYVEVEGELREIQSIIIEGEVKGREYILNLNLALGHILENTVAQEEVYNQVNTQGID